MTLTTDLAARTPDYRHGYHDGAKAVFAGMLREIAAGLS